MHLSLLYTGIIIDIKGYIYIQLNSSQKRLNEIHEEKIKAGLDYVTNKVTKYYGVPYGVVISTEKRIDFKDD